MRAADVFMFNSTWECNPLVLREATSFGLKILSRNLEQYMDMFTPYITQINDDLTAAEGLISTSEGVTFMGLDFATALRARMAAYRGQYAVADGYAASLLANYQIANTSAQLSIFSSTMLSTSISRIVKISVAVLPCANRERITDLDIITKES